MSKNLAVAGERMLLRRPDISERAWQLMEQVERFPAELRENEILACPLGAKAAFDLELHRARLPGSFIFIRAGDRIPDR